VKQDYGYSRQLTFLTFPIPSDAKIFYRLMYAALIVNDASFAKENGTIIGMTNAQ